MANYTKTTIGKENRIELHEKLSLTGAEISLNELPAGANVPFVHSHKENEEIYGILSGNGKAIIDGEEISLSTGDWLKIAPAAKRQLFASDVSGITYICIQVKENSLEHFTAEDAVIGKLKVFICKNAQFPISRELCISFFFNFTISLFFKQELLDFKWRQINLSTIISLIFV